MLRLRPTDYSALDDLRIADRNDPHLRCIRRLSPNLESLTVEGYYFDNYILQMFEGVDR